MRRPVGRGGVDHPLATDEVGLWVPSAKGGGEARCLSARSGTLCLPRRADPDAAREDQRTHSGHIYRPALACLREREMTGSHQNELRRATCLWKGAPPPLFLWSLDCSSTDDDESSNLLALPYSIALHKLWISYKYSYSYRYQILILG